MRDCIYFAVEHCKAIMSFCMKLHNYCIKEDSVRGKRGCDVLNDALSPQERREVELD